MKTEVKPMTPSQVEFFATWKSILMNLRNGGCYGIEWNQELNLVQITHPTPHNNLCIDITMIDKTMGGGISIDLVNLDADVDDFAEYYISGYQFGNTMKDGLTAVEYLADLITELN